jgi:hypothetical protein
MGGEQADICFTSPPYAQQRNYKTGPQDWDALMQGVFSILPVKHGAQILVNLGLVHHDGEWLPYWDGWIEYGRLPARRSNGARERGEHSRDLDTRAGEACRNLRTVGTLHQFARSRGGDHLGARVDGAQ